MAWAWEPRAQARRLLAGERGAVRKEWGGRLPIALVYPNRYAVGMGSLAIHLLYKRLNERPDVVCERVFPALNGRGPGKSDDLEAGKETRLQQVGLSLSLESQRPLGEFPVAAFSVAYELDYPHVVGMLRSAGIPLRAEEREAGDPIVVAGGMAVTANPEPLAPFLDAVVLGDAEPVLDPLVEALKEVQGAPRPEVWERLDSIPGVYVPALYEVAYGEDGRLVRLAYRGQVWEGVGRPLPGVVWRAVYQPTAPEPACTVIFSDRAEFGNLFLLEVARGCQHGCAFCLAGYAARPVRYWDVEVLLERAREGLRHREGVGLVGSAVSDHPQMDRLVLALREMGARVSVSSWRADALSEVLLQALAASGARSITLAPETGTERLRRRIGKGIPDAAFQRAAELAGRLGFRQIKLYFMVGLPGETEEDIAAIGTLSEAVAKWSGLQVVASLSPFVPKAQTPLERESMLQLEVLEPRLRWLVRDLARRGVQVRAESAAWAQVQAALARGNRTLALALGAVERYTLRGWHAALERVGVEVAPALAGIAEGTLPWAHIGGSGPRALGGSCALDSRKRGPAPSGTAGGPGADGRPPRHLRPSGGHEPVSF
ncbi:MAG: B12-binding domain-containing radical SAM protein [Anaerolineae bacterium]